MLTKFNVLFLYKKICHSVCSRGLNMSTSCCFWFWFFFIIQISKINFQIFLPISSTIDENHRINHRRKEIGTKCIIIGKYEYSTDGPDGREIAIKTFG